MGNRNSDPWGFLPADRGRLQKCFECGEMTTGRHHVVPVVFGGSKVIPLCRECHTMVHGYVSCGDAIKEGLKKAQLRGVKLGSPRKVTHEVISQVAELRKKGKSHRAIAKIVGLSIGSIVNADKCSKKGGCSKNPL